MSIPVSIERLLREHIVEDSRIELKSGWNPQSVIHTLCAFANDIDNSGGGYLVIGIKEVDGKIEDTFEGLPLESIETIQKELLGNCKRITPEYYPQCEPVEFEGRNLLLIWAPGGHERPYSAPVSFAKHKNERAHYIRRFASTVEARGKNLKDLFYLASNVPFDDRPNHQAKMSDLQVSKIRSFLVAIESNMANVSEDLTTEDLARNMRISSGPDENILPLNVGLMFFSDNPEDYFRDARIEVINVPDPTGVNMVERTFSGSLDRQLIDALEYIRNSVIAEKVVKRPDRPQANRFFNYPYIAIEEALANAVYHKSYQEHEPITVRIESDRIIINSCPGPDISIKDEDIARGRMIAKRYRNRRIGEHLKELKLAEGRSTGIPTIIREMLANGSLPPLFETDEERTYFTVNLMIHPSFAQQEEPAVVEQTPAKRTRRTRKQLGEAILEVLRQGELSRSEIAARLGYSSVSNTMAELITDFIEAGALEYNTSEKNSPNAKLRLK